MAPLGLHGWRQRLSREGVALLMPLGFRAGSSAFPVMGERKNCAVRPLRLVAVPSLRGRNACGAARPSWLAAALRSVLGMRPGKSKCGTRTWEIECFLERPRRADGAQRLSPCWWRRTPLGESPWRGKSPRCAFGVPKSPVTGSNAWRAPSATLCPAAKSPKMGTVSDLCPAAESPKMGIVSDLRGRT